MIAVIVILLILFVILGGAAYYYFTQMKSEPTVRPSVEPLGLELLITEKGATIKENYKMMPKREGYIEMPEMHKCYTSGVTAPDYCSLHNRSTDGFVYVYDLSSAEPRRYTECLGGGHECWYIEKFDQNGNLVDIVDKNGVKLLDKIAEDVWADRWDMNNPGISRLVEEVEYKDGKLIALKDMKISDKSIISPGSEITINDLGNKTAYFIYLIIAMKNAGHPKPDRIVLNVAGGKAVFDDVLTAIIGASTST